MTAGVDLAVVDDATRVPLVQCPAFAALGRRGRPQRIRAAARLVTGINGRTAGVLLA